MSTTFGVEIEGEVIPVARRKGIGQGKVHVYSVNPLIHILDDELEVVPMDNTAQGVLTVKDLKKLMIR